MGQQGYPLCLRAYLWLLKGKWCKVKCIRMWTCWLPNSSSSSNSTSSICCKILHSKTPLKSWVQTLGFKVCNKSNSRCINKTTKVNIWRDSLANQMIIAIRNKSMQLRRCLLVIQLMDANQARLARWTPWIMVATFSIDPSKILWAIQPIWRHNNLKVWPNRWHRLTCMLCRPNGKRAKSKRRVSWLSRLRHSKFPRESWICKWVYRWATQG